MLILKGDTMSSRKILIIDDNIGITKLLEALLVQRGYGVAVAQGGEEGINVAKSYAPDLILLDLKMPDLTGDITAMRIRSERTNRDTPIIAISAYGDSLTRSTTRAMGFEDHVAKPFDAEDLCKRIEKALSVSTK